MPIPNFLTKIFSSGAGELINSIGKVVDNLVTSKEEKETLKQALIQEVNRNVERMTELSNQETELYLKDVSSAREANARIQESDKSSWLSKNVAYILDFVFVISFLIMLFVIIYKQVPETNKELFYTAFGLLGGYVSTVINFHRGTSKGSEDKSKQLHEISKK